MYSKKTYEEVSKDLKSDLRKGLSSDEAQKRLDEVGFNELEGKKKTPLILRFLAQFKDTLIIILLIAALVSVIVDYKEWLDSVIILVVVILNATLGIIQESKAEKSLEALKKISAPHAKVIRDGIKENIEVRELVPGDLVLVEAGDIVPADCRIIECSNLLVDESALTGESVFVNKNSDVLENVESLGDKKNMLYSSTIVNYGRATAMVVKTAMNTEVGKIAVMLNSEESTITPLQHKLSQIGKTIGIMSLVICALVFVLQLIAKETPIDAFKTAIALAVAAIPEGLVAIVTLVLALGVQKMAKSNAIVKKLPAVETLGSASIVCSDKTGTLTQNKMTVVKMFHFQDGLLDISDKLSTQAKEMIDYFSLCCDADITNKDGKEILIGDPTETALVYASNTYATPRASLLQKYERVEEIPFESTRKMMSVVIKTKDRYFSITKGAPDIVLGRCKSSPSINKALEANEAMGQKALRVLAVAIKEYPSMPTSIDSESLENNMTFIGLVGMIDPARPEVKDAIATAKKAGIRSIMITGDHIVTAKAIAYELGILNDNQLAITGADLNKLSDEELQENIDKYSVYARVAPEHKVRIVNAWQKKGHVVAMTGDGVNDSPALKTADIGCAMGITGTDVTKEAAAMILADDNFATIIYAVKEGRGIYKNIKKNVQYLLSSNIGEVVTILLASLIAAFTSLELGTPLLPIHLLWINLITDSLPAFALAMEKTDDKLMNEKPRKKDEGFFAGHMAVNIAWQGLFIGLLTLVAYVIGNSESHNLGMTMAFLTLALTQLIHAFSIKSDKSVFGKHIFNNKFLWGAFALGFGLQLFLIYIPGVNDVFDLVALDFVHIAISVGLALVMLAIMEIYKIARKIVIKKKSRG